jgi:hypothetical protein
MRNNIQQEILITKNLNQDDLKTSTEFFLSPSGLGAFASQAFQKGSDQPQEMISLQYTKEMLEESHRQIKNGDLSILEEVLLSQALVLNIASTNLATRANRQTDASTMQMLMNLAFKAQNQSRATIDSLINLKQPNQTAFIKQTNIAHGHQQVNNSLENNSIPQNELFEESCVSSKMDARATIKAK